MSEETIKPDNDISEYYEKMVEARIKGIAEVAAKRVMDYRENVENSLYDLSKEIGVYARSVLDKGKPLDLGTIYEIQMMVEHLAVEISRMQP